MDEIKIVFERKPLSPYQEEALATLNQKEGAETKKALFLLIDNYIKDLADHYFVNGVVTIKDVLLKFNSLKIAVEKAKSIHEKNKNKNTK